MRFSERAPSLSPARRAIAGWLVAGEFSRFTVRALCATIAMTACESDATVLGALPLCSNGLRDGNETGVDCGGDQCGPCGPGQGCRIAGDCQIAIGAGCVNGTCLLGGTCAEIKARNPAASDGTYSVDPAGAGAPASALPVYCDMTTSGGGWTRVGFEPTMSAGSMIQGSLPYLGIEVGTPDAVARATGPGLIGTRFSGTYRELAITWGGDYARMTVPGDIFVNSVDVAIPVGQFTTSDSTLAGWVSAGGGAVFCRASRATDIRPGDTSWGIKPRDSTGSACGCNNPIWKDRGAFYGGLLMPTVCASYGGSWAGVVSVDIKKGGQSNRGDLALWVR